MNDEEIFASRLQGLISCFYNGKLKPNELKEQVKMMIIDEF